MLDVAKEIKEEAFFDFSWAAEGPYIDSYLKIKDLIIKKGLTNVKVTNNIEKNMNERFAQVHCTIIPYTQFGDFVKLTRVWEKIVESNPDNFQYRLSLASAYIKTFQDTKAIVELQKIIELNSNFKNQGEAYIKQIREGKLQR